MLDTVPAGVLPVVFFVLVVVSVGFPSFRIIIMLAQVRLPSTTVQSRVCCALDHAKVYRIGDRGRRADKVGEAGPAAVPALGAISIGS